MHFCVLRPVGCSYVPSGSPGQMYRCRGPISQSKSGVNIIHNIWCITEMHGPAFFATGRGGAGDNFFRAGPGRDQNSQGKAGQKDGKIMSHR